MTHPASSPDEKSPRLRYGAWQNEAYLAPLLKTRWHQYAPYNARSPIRRSKIAWGDKAHAPIGCVPLAIGQIFGALADKTETLPDRDKWSILGETAKVYPFSSKAVSRTLSEKLAMLARQTIIWANYHFSLGSPLRALKCFRKNGFPEARLKWFKKDKKSEIIRHLSHHKPLLFMGLDPPLQGHAWVVDGYARNVRVKETLREDGTVEQSEKEVAEYLHCNFGWGGTANGFYPLGDFDTTTGPFLTDRDIDTAGVLKASRNFTRFVHFVSY